MTPLTKPVSRLTSSTIRSTGKKKMRRLTATLMPTAVGDLIVLRPEGCGEGQALQVDLLDDVWSFAVKMKARQIVRERQEKRKQRRAS